MSERFIHADTSTRSRYTAMLEGFSAPFRGLRYMGQHPTLWRHAIVPIILNLLITVAVLVVFVIASVAVAMWLHEKFPNTWWGWTGEALTIVGLGLVAMGGSAATWLLLQGILCGYFNTRLACQVELQLGMRREDIKDVPFSYQVSDTIRNTTYLLAVNGGFLLLNLVPIVGSLIAVCGSLYFDCHILGREYFDYPLSLRGLRRSDKLKFCSEHGMQVIGLGASALLLNFIPLIGAVLLATAVTGSVLLHRELQSYPASSPEPVS